jgi:hypothetical protein
MNHTRTGVPSRPLGAVLLGLALVASGCAANVSRRQTDIMEQSGKLSVSAAVLRARVDSLVDDFAGTIEQTADRIIAETADDAVRRRALVLKVDVIPAVYAAGFRVDPLVAAIDVWGFAFQFSEYMEQGAGRNAFGLQQPLIRNSARDLLADADAVLEAIAIHPDYFNQTRTTVESWARAHPVEHGFGARASGAALLGDLRADGRNAFQAVGAVSDTVEILSERLNTYAAQWPKQARWQAEILAVEMAGTYGVESVVDNLREVGPAARRTAEVLGDVPGLFQSGHDILADERQALLAGIDGQRVQALEYMTAERLAVLAAVRDERTALVAALRQERIEALIEVDAITARAVDSVHAGLRDLVHDTLWRAAIFLVGLMFLAATLAVITYHLTAGRHRRPTS